jgi:hypothetical protein
VHVSTSEQLEHEKDKNEKHVCATIENQLLVINMNCLS